jgi:hypothetical protein
VAVPLPLPSAPRTAPDETVAADVPATVFARMNLGEETVERTLYLRERPVLEITAGPGRGRVFPLSPESATSFNCSRMTTQPSCESRFELRSYTENGNLFLF